MRRGDGGIQQRLGFCDPLSSNIDVLVPMEICPSKSTSVDTARGEELGSAAEVAGGERGRNDRLVCVPWRERACRLCWAVDRLKETSRRRRGIERWCCAAPKVRGTKQARTLESKMFLSG